MKHSTGIVKKLGAHLVNHIASGTRMGGWRFQWSEHTFRVVRCVLFQGISAVGGSHNFDGPLCGYFDLTLCNTIHAVCRFGWCKCSACLPQKKHSSHSNVSEGPRRVVAPPLSHLTLPANLPETQNCQCWRQRVCSSCVRRVLSSSRSGDRTLNSSPNYLVLF